MARILVADNDTDQLAVHRILLETLGYEVCQAVSPADTLRAVECRAPDLVVIDLRFPAAADGLALIRDLYATGRALPLIVLSGWPDDLYGAPEEQLVSRIVMKGSVRELMQVIAELLAPAA